MYLYQVDNAVTYTSEDLVLFKESPFASWMERLTLENPDHGIPPDPGSQPPVNSMTRQDDIAETLRAEGKQVLLVDWGADEPGRRTATLNAMRQGVDFIVNGQLALGSLSGSANLLMRTSGFSDLGDYLYIPCDTQGKTTLPSAFRLCFLADLLHSLQGQLPPQMLIIRGGDIVPLQTEDHIYHYRAVKLRFMEAMRDFRKHRMPDPSESPQFGRWSECANELLRQRALRKNDDWQEVPTEVPAEPLEEPRVAAAGAAPVIGTMAPSTDTTRRTVAPGAQPGRAVLSPGGQIPSGPTLAEQARLLATETQAPRAEVAIDHGVSTEALVQPPTAFAGGADAALENLEFIGSASRHSGAHRLGRARDPAPKPLPPEEEALAQAEQDQAPESSPVEEAAPATAESAPAPEPLVDEMVAPAAAGSDSPGHASPGHASPGHASPGRASPGHASPGRASPGHDVAALHTADYLPLEMSPESEPVEIDVPIIAVQPEEQQWAAAIDFDLPELAEPLPLPEVEEIGLDGTLLPDDWGVDASPQTAAPPPVAAGLDAPPATLAGVDSRGGPVAEASDKANEPLSHPLDAAVLLPEAGNPVVDSDSTPVVVPPAGLVTEEGGLPPESPVLAEVESAPVPAPREDPDEPAPRRPFSDSLITSDSFEE